MADTPHCATGHCGAVAAVAAHLQDAALIYEGAIATALLLILALYPICWYLARGWTWRELLINRSLTRAAKDEYLFVFQREERDVTTAETRFRKFYATWYGRHHIAIPAAFFAILVAIAGWFLSVYAIAVVSPGALPASIMVIPPTAAAALAGGYTFTTFDMIERVTRRDLSPNDVCLAAFRLTIAVPLGYTFQALAAPGAGALIAFGLAAFPFQAVVAGLRKIGARQLGLDVGADNAVERVTLLAGLDLNIADRIREADVFTISQLAYSDPIQLAMRTNLGLTYMIDVVSQAQAWVYLGDRLNKVRAFGLRGAFEFVALRNELFRPPESDEEPWIAMQREVASKLLAEASKAIDLTPAEFLNCVHQIADDPYARFLVQVYG